MILDDPSQNLKIIYFPAMLSTVVKGIMSCSKHIILTSTKYKTDVISTQTLPSDFTCTFD